MLLDHMYTESSSFTDSLRRKSARAHSISDALVHLRFVSVLIDTELYAKAIACFYFVLKRIENDLKQLQLEDPRVVEFYEKSRGLFRSNAIEKDLRFFLGPSWHKIALQHSKPYSEDYLRHIERSMPSKLCIVIHTYTQLAAFASGGRILARKLLLKTLFSVEDRGHSDDIDSVPEGLHAFQYDSDVGDLKVEMKNALNALATKLTPEEEASLMDEHAMVFTLNNGIIQSLKIGFMTSAKAYASWIYKKASSIMYTKNMALGCVAVMTVGVLVHQMPSRQSRQDVG